ncbi:MAG: aldehyde dehydrogenase family protein [Candidatus Omnitrophota bacterium]
MSSGSLQKIINPSNSEVIAEVPLAGPKDLELVLFAARKAFDQGPWPKLSLKERQEFILKISKGILDNAGELAKTETLNTGKPIKESTFMDIPSSAKVFEYFADNLERLLESETLDLENAQSRLVREPIGVVLLIVPWNYPLLIASWKMSQALAAGNVVILKPSSLTPLTALELGKIANNAGLPGGVVNVVNASGDSAGKILCSDKRVDMISFTGSNIVGKEILGYVSENVKKLILELGGKSAGIILKDADLEVAVNSALCSIFLNQGQMCTAMSRIFIQDDIYDKFVAEFVKKTKQIKLGPGSDYETQMGPLISESQRKKVLEYVEKAKKEGAKLICGGKIPDSPELKKGFFFEPAVLTEVRPQMSVFQEEIFGPVAVFSKFSGLDEAIKLVNNSDFGLAASIWTKDASKANQLAGKINAGTVWVNTYGMFYPQAPYGGFKQSGFGKELGREGFLEYTRLKNIFTDRTPDDKPLVNYWYGF